MFKCADCGKFPIFFSYKTRYGEELCENCNNLRNIRIKAKIDDLDQRGLFQLVDNLFEKYPSEIPEDEVDKLRRLFKVKYEIDIADNIFVDLICGVKAIIDERNELNRFEKDLLKNNSKNLSFKINEKPFFCNFCKRIIDEKTYEYSKEKLGKPLCRTHQGSLSQKKLFLELRKKGIDCEYEFFDGHKHIDIAIHDAKMYIEIDGPLHETNVNQFISDGYRDEFSSNDGYFTKRIPVNYIDENLNGITDVIKKTVEIRKNKLRK